MKVVIAIDSFKGSLTSMEAAEAVRNGILAAKPDARIIIKPVADGGEGTVDALTRGTDARRITAEVSGPYREPVSCSYAYLPDTYTAVIEMAAASGITLSEKRDPLLATSYGTGQLIAHGIRNGFRNFIIGIGGSATNDGGTGMLRALGFRFLDRNGQDAGDGARALEQIRSIDLSGCMPELSECRFRVACDVTNPLCGKDGATYVYGPQKGMADELLDKIDRDMNHYASLTAAVTGRDFAAVPGSGAAGGLGFALLSYMNAELFSGVGLILNATGAEKELENADYAVTGEGRIDRQTPFGKVPAGVAALAGRHNVRVIAFAGSVSENPAVYAACRSAGIHAVFPVIREITTLREAMLPERAKSNLTACAEQVFRLL